MASYTYIVRSIENDIIGVYSSKKKAEMAAETYIKIQGAESGSLLKEENDWISFTVPVKEEETFEKVSIERWQIK